MPEALPVESFLAHSAHVPVIDVRTPTEFANGHIPGAVNVPVLSDDERAAVGTAYKQLGQREAVRIGLKQIGPRMNALAAQILALCDPAGGEVRVHCWRGGMRSGGVAWLMEAFGCRVATLAGGYKAFRRWVLGSFALRRDVRVIAGLTGTGKTAVLQELAARGECVVDLEALARHKGSAFGDLGEPTAPGPQQFENELAIAWRATDPSRPVWVEDESRMIGRLVLPETLWQQKQAGRFLVIDLPDDARIARLCTVYAGFPAGLLVERVTAIQRRLGGDRARAAITAIEAGDLAAACRLILPYYDRTYRRCLEPLPADRKRTFSFANFDPPAIAETLVHSAWR